MQNSTEACRDQYEQQLIHNDEVQRIPGVLDKGVCIDLFVLKHLSLLVQQRWHWKPPVVYTGLQVAAGICLSCKGIYSQFL